jgi:hypothetical protein
LGTSIASSSPHRHRRRHRHHHRGSDRGRDRMPTYARFAIPILVVLLLGGLVWKGAHSLLHLGRNHGSANVAHAEPAPLVPPWIRDFDDSLDATGRAAASGDLSAAEIEVDRAESFVTIAGLEHRPAPPDFFSSASAQLDRVTQQNPDQGFFEHVTSVRIELAGLRSAQATPPPEPAGGSFALYSPRHLAANQTLDPATLRGKYLDGKPLPELSEILLPPTSRSLADNIRVEDITLAGAAQTLDGIHWRNVTFVGTRLRYEGGGLSLQNVRFIGCRFGLPNDERGARIATAITLAPPPGAITIEIPAASPATASK